MLRPLLRLCSYKQAFTISRFIFMFFALSLRIRLLVRKNKVRTIVVDEVDACWDMQEPIGQSLHSILAKHMNPSHDDQLLLQVADYCNSSTAIACVRICFFRCILSQALFSIAWSSNALKWWSHSARLLKPSTQGGKAVTRAPPGGSSCSSGRGKATSLDALLASSSSSSNTKPTTAPAAVQAVFVSASVPQPKHFMKQCVQRRWVAADRGAPSFVR